MKTVSERRLEQKKEMIESLSSAQKIIFAPLSFQAISAMIDFGILESLDNFSKTVEELVIELDLKEYVVKTLLEVGETVGVVQAKGRVFSLTKMGSCFLYDEMTRVNFNFIKDCCYLGASKLAESFKQEKPMGLKTFFDKDSDTIYPNLPNMPDMFKKSWYEFDNYYSDNCFDLIYSIISKKSPKKVFDIGGNTGQFERVCLENNLDIDITMLDMPNNINVVKSDKTLAGCKFCALDILDEKCLMPKMSGAILMSQFLDCFSKENIKFILDRVKRSSAEGTYIYILEPFIDNQKYEGAKLSLTHTSLYFTCMANGYSKMYSCNEMIELVEEVGLTLENVYNGIGAHDYTLLECRV